MEMISINMENIILLFDISIEIFVLFNNKTIIFSMIIIIIILWMLEDFLHTKRTMYMAVPVSVVKTH